MTTELNTRFAMVKTELSNLRKDDKFLLFEHDCSPVGNGKAYIAIGDGYTLENGIGGVNCEEVESI